MSESPETKHKVPVKNYPEGTKPKRVAKEVTETLKGVVSTKKIGKLKKQYVECPVLKEDRNFVECFACKSHIRRVMGEVDCAGGSTEFQI